jgi:hypothetical protein
MHTNDKFEKLAVLVIMASLLFSLTILATAQSDAVRAMYVSAANVPTNMPGIRTYAAPAKGFNPVTASDVELATYGFPPRPDKQVNPDRYAVWERAMMAAKIRWNGELTTVPGTEHVTIPARSTSPPVAPVQAGPQQQANADAGGVILTNTQTEWSNKNSFNTVFATISVPKAALPYNFTGCTASDYKQFNFAGIDSLYENLNGKVYILFPGLQGGFYADLPCSDNVAGTPFYYIEFGWSYPLSRGFAVNPGDVIFTDVEGFGPTGGEVYLEDITTQTSASYSVSTSGMIGHNAGWLVFRPCCTGGTAPPPSNDYPLPNTVNVFFGNAFASTGAGKQFYPGSQASSTVILSMMDDAGDQVIEGVSQGTSGYQGQHQLTLATENCAGSGGCSP